MPRHPPNPSNTSHPTRGAGGDPGSARSTYPDELAFADAQNTSNPSSHYVHGNHGGNSSSSGNSSSNATSGGNRNRNENYGSPNQSYQPYGPSNSSSNSLPNSQLEEWERQSARHDPWSGLRGTNSNSRGGFEGQGTAGRVDQSGGRGEVSSSRQGGNGYQTEDGDADSLRANHSSQSSASSSGGRR